MILFVIQVDICEKSQHTNIRKIRPNVMASRVEKEKLLYETRKDL